MYATTFNITLVSRKNHPHQAVTLKICIFWKSLHLYRTFWIRLASTRNNPLYEIATVELLINRISPPSRRFGVSFVKALPGRGCSSNFPWGLGLAEEGPLTVHKVTLYHQHINNGLAEL